MPRLYALNEDLNLKLRAIPFTNGVGVLARGGDTTYFDDAGYGVDNNKHAADIFDQMTRAELEAYCTYAGIAWAEEDTKQEIVRAIETAISTANLGALTVTSGAGGLTPGTLVVRVTSALLDGGYKDVSVVVLGTDNTVAAVAGKVRTALAADADIAAVFTVGGADADIAITAIDPAADDATLAVSLQDDDSTGIQFGASANTAAGVATALQQETMVVTHGAVLDGTLKVTATSALLDGGFKIIDAPVLSTDTTADAVAGKIRTALAADADVAANYTVGGTGANVMLTALVGAADDATLAIALSYAGATGVTIGASGDTAAGVAPVAQVETLQVTGGATYSGIMIVTLTGALLTGGNKAVNVPVSAGDTAEQVAEKIGIALAADTDINAHYTCTNDTDTVVVTANVAAANDATLALALTSAGTTSVTVGASADTQAGVATAQQQETMSVTGGASGAGNAIFKVTSALFGSGEEPFVVPITADDDTTGEVATKIRAAIVADADISEHFDVSGTGDNVVITAKVAAANDATLAIELVDADGSGIMVGASANTTAGNAGQAQIETITVTAGASADGKITFFVNIVTGVASDTIEVDVANGDSASDVAEKIRTALASAENTPTAFSIGGSGADVVLTTLAYEENNADVAMSLLSDGDTSVTVGASTDDTAGNAGTAQVETADVATAAVNGGGTLKVTVTSALLDGGSKDVLVAVTAEDDTVSEVAAKIRAALAADADVGGAYTVGGAGASLVLTARVKAANDATLDIALASDGDTTVTADASTDTTTGVAGVSQVETVAVTDTADVKDAQITVAGDSGGDFKYYIAAGAQAPLYMDDVTHWTAIESGDDVDGDNVGDVITVAEINANNRVVALGSATVAIA